jgi:hypothetical protein
MMLIAGFVASASLLIVGRKRTPLLSQSPDQNT